MVPAPRFGAFRWYGILDGDSSDSCHFCILSSDTPLALGMSALQAIPALTETKDTGFAWTIYTGDLVSHDVENQLSR